MKQNYMTKAVLGLGLAAALTGCGTNPIHSTASNLSAVGYGVERSMSREASQACDVLEQSYETSLKNLELKHFGDKGMGLEARLTEVQNPEYLGEVKKLHTLPESYYSDKEKGFDESLCETDLTQKYSSLAGAYKFVLDYEARTGNLGSSVALPSRYGRLSDDKKFEVAKERLLNYSSNYTPEYVLNQVLKISAIDVDKANEVRQMMAPVKDITAALTWYNILQTKKNLESQNEYKSYSSVEGNSPTQGTSGSMVQGVNGGGVTIQNTTLPNGGINLNAL